AQIDRNAARKRVGGASCRLIAAAAHETPAAETTLAIVRRAMNPPQHPCRKGDVGYRIRSDMLASLVVFLVALPLCMGIGIASGAPVAAGLVTGIIGGIVVGRFGGSPLQVSGPAAGLTVVCAEVAGRHGLPALGVVVVLAGAIQIAAGLLKLGQWFR